MIFWDVFQNILHTFEDTFYHQMDSLTCLYSHMNWLTFLMQRVQYEAGGPLVVSLLLFLVCASWPPGGSITDIQIGMEKEMVSTPQEAAVILVIY